MGKASAFVAGAGAAYLLDPARGKRRRHVLRDRTFRLVTRTRRLSGKKARFTLGRLRGIAARARTVVRGRDVATDDRTVEQRIRSSVLRHVGVKGSDVEIRVERGIVTLRGEIEGRIPAEDLIRRVREVPGVEDVTAMLRVTNPAGTG